MMRRTGCLLKMSWCRRRTRVVVRGARIPSSSSRQEWLPRAMDLSGMSVQPMADPNGSEPPVCVFYYPIGASGINPGRKPGANPSTTPFFEGGLHLNYSRWFYRTRPTLYRTPTEAARWPESILRFAASGVLGGVPVRTPIGGPVACKSKVGSFRGS